MKYKRLADTNVFLPAVGMGTWEYKGGVETLRKGIAGGATLIDTARSLWNRRNSWESDPMVFESRFS